MEFFVITIIIMFFLFADFFSSNKTNDLDCQYLYKWADWNLTNIVQNEKDGVMLEDEDLKYHYYVFLYEIVLILGLWLRFMESNVGVPRFILGLECCGTKNSPYSF